ncbi:MULTISPECIES: hypothetical protein [Bacillus cereus group]|nr:hypothetical protein [Bacillus thuringiensis]MED1641172.1 hypothetical protein [Bacillus thuringiensis]
MKKTFKYILIFFCAVFYITFISCMIYQNFVREHFIPKSKMERKDS